MNFSQSRLAAKLQEMVSIRREETGLYTEIAGILPLQDSGRLLDIGTGTGLQLRVINEIKPDLELYGLDISARSIHLAREHLKHQKVDLRVGSIEKTDYDGDFFDIITCNASMSYWKNLGVCFDEIYRILKPSGSAHLIEPRKDIDINEAVEIIRENLAGESRLRIFLATNLNKFGLRWGGRLGLKLYTEGEIDEIAQHSLFGDRVSIEPATLQNIPMFMHIILKKPACDFKHRE